MDYVLPNELVDGMIAAGGKKSTVSVKNLLIRGFYSGAILGLAVILALTVGITVKAPFVGSLLFPFGFASIVLFGMELVTGNFALLIGADPAQVHRWYLEIYADAYEWVELPNTLGMSQFGDGGLLASKPYASSGNYIDKMSDYCDACRYNVKTRTEEDSCPFNSLYWDFLARNEDKLSGNSRMALAYRNWDNKETGEKISLRAKARAVLDSLNEL